jgi:cyanophycin synthetase
MKKGYENLTGTGNYNCQMKVLNVRTTDGPNYWSVHRHQLVVMTLDLEEMEECPTHKIPGFYERISALLPSLYRHRCSEGVEGGFFHRVQTGTWMGHVIEHIALEIQTLAGMDTGFGRTRDAGRKGLYHVVFSFVDAEAGKYAGSAAVRIAGALIRGDAYDLRADIAALNAIRSRNLPGPSTAAILEEARKRDIPVLRLNNSALFQLGYGAGQRRIEAAVTSATSHIAVEIAADKAATKQLLANAAVPVPEGATACSEEELVEIAERLGYPVAVKPLDGNHGKGATLDIRDAEMVRKAFHTAQAFSPEVVCERFITGHDFRALVVNYKFIAAAWREPAAVTGDGVHTVEELVAMVNLDPMRGACHENLLTRISIDESTSAILQRQGYTLQDVVPERVEVRLKDTANLSTGGTATDVTDSVHPDNRVMFERIARVIGLDICGIDIIASGLSKPLTANGGAVIEVNAGPGLRMHLQPSHGKARNVAAPIVDMLFPHGADGRIPIIGITGTNGKTTTTRLIAQIGRKAGYNVGYTTTDGVYIDQQRVQNGDCTGPHSARMVLRDPSVNLAVLECARGGLLREGLGFDKCDVAVITNIAEDHLGISGINTLEKLARLKGVLAESVGPEGYAVLNADDDHVYALKEQLHCHVALFSMNADSWRIREHVRAGGMAAMYENGYLSLIQGGMMTRIGLAKDLPITFGGAASFNIANALAAALAACVQGIDAADIYHALRSFLPSPETLPGRMNVYDFGHFKVIVDYGHNAHGLRSVGAFLRSMQATVKIGVIAGVGDRRDEDIVAIGAEAARIFDEIIVRQDDDLRGRTADELIRLVCKGVLGVAPFKKITVIPNELASVEAVLQQARNGMIATIFADNIGAVTQVVQQAQASGNFLLNEKEVA